MNNSEVKTELKTITLAVFDATNATTSKEKEARIKMNESGLFKMNAIAAGAIAAGISAYVNELQKAIADNGKVPSSISLERYMISVKFSNIAELDDDFMMELNRSEVELIREHIVSALHEEEANRDADNKFEQSNGGVIDQSYTNKHNPNKYIQLRYLLLDVREWLCGEIITVY